MEAIAHDLENTRVNEDIPKNEEGTPYVTINGTQYPPLADGEYDAIILSTGLEECILAGLLSVRGKKVLQIDRNSYYGGSCASLNLEELYQKGKSDSFNLKEIEKQFGSSRNFCVDLVPKLLMANGKLVKMLIQTGVTKYMDFNGIYGSYVYNSGKIYKLPVTPSEALTSSLVRMFQKPKLRSFAELVAKYKLPRKVANTLTLSQFIDRIASFYKIFNPAKSDIEEIRNLVQKFEPNNRRDLVYALEDKYVFSVFPSEKSVTFQEGPLGMIIEGIGISALLTDPSYKVKSFIRVKDIAKMKGTKGQAEASNVIRKNDILYKINDKVILGLSEREVKNLIMNTPRPCKIVFITPNNSLSHILKSGVKSFKAKQESRKNGKDPLDLRKMTAKQVMTYFGLDSDTQNFLGHGMALKTNDAYLEDPAEDFIASCQLYAHSIGRYGQNSPYLYPLYGLASLPEGFSRLSAIYGGTVMLRTDISEVLYNTENGKASGVRVGDQAAKANLIIGDASFFPSDKSKKTGSVIRSICFLKEKIKGISAKGDSAQIILPAKHLANKSNDVYISMLSNSHQVSSKHVYLAIASTKVETANPVSELQAAFDLMGNIEEKFDFVSDTFEPVDKMGSDSCHITCSLDATSHFESAANDIMRIYKNIFKVDLNLEEKIVQTD